MTNKQKEVVMQYLRHYAKCNDYLLYIKPRVRRESGTSDKYVMPNIEIKGIEELDETVWVDFVIHAQRFGSAGTTHCEIIVEYKELFAIACNGLQ